MPEVVVLRLAEQENVEPVLRLLTEDRRTSVQVIADRLNTGKETVSRIVAEDLGRKKDLREICSSRVDHRAETRTPCSPARSSLMGQDKRFWENIITGDETWCFAYDPANKRQSEEWVGQNSPQPKKLRFQQVCVRAWMRACVLCVCVYECMHA